MTDLFIKDYLKRCELPILPIIGDMLPWQAIQNIEGVIVDLIEILDLTDYEISGNQAIHKNAEIERIAQLKGAMIIGPRCFVANGCLLRDGVILDAKCIVGHCVELKTSIMLTGSKITHLNFVGDSILGSQTNLEAGAMIANYRNEYANKDIYFTCGNQSLKTGVQKFGAILGEGTRVGANAVIAPGTILPKNSIVKRGAVIDQCEEFKL